MRHFVRLSFCLALALLVWAPAIASAQEPTVVNGRVTNEAGAPLAGVQVFLPDLTLGSQTDANGAYTFIVPAARVRGQSVALTARGIGLKPKTVQIVLAAPRVTQDFVLTQTAVQLSAVVVTGVGTTTTQEKLGNKIDRVDNTEIAKSNEFNIAAALSAKAPNLQIQSQSGDPGASVSLMIRGIKTLTGDGQPLWVVDGVPINNSTINNEGAVGLSNQGVVSPNRASDINPADIESVEILKGAAAAAIYGSRAAQGVILVTTKSGRAGATRYSFRSSYSFDNVNKRYDLQKKFGQGSEDPLGIPRSGICTKPDCGASPFSWGPELTPTAYVAALTTPLCDAACAQARFQELFPDGIKTYDHMKDIFETGHAFNNDISISGGDDRRTFYLSAGRSQNKGFVIGPNDEYTRNTVRLKATQRLTDRLNVGGNLAYVDTRGSFVQRGNNVSGLMLGSLRTPPEFNNANYLTATGFHRAYRFPNPTAISQNRSRGYDNPFFIAYREPASSKLGRVYGNVTLEYLPLEWLTVKYSGGGDYSSDERLTAFPLTAGGNGTIGPKGGLNRSNFVNYILDHNLLAIGRHTFGPNFETELTVGQSLNATAFRQVFVTGTDLIAPEPFKLANTVSYTPNDEETLVHRESYFGQLRLDLYDQLYLTVAGRNDGSSAFAQNNRRHSYPKASAAWTFSKALGGYTERAKMDFGKVRFAYGVTGKEPDPYSTLFAYTRGVFGEYGGAVNQTPYNGQAGLVSPALIGQDKLKPERTTELEYGLDFGFLNGFSDISLTFYSATSKDVIFEQPQPASRGFTLQVQNAAEITNRGSELTWNFHPVRRDNVSWDLGLLWSRNRNNVVRIGTCTGAGFASGACQQEVIVGSGNFGQSVARPGFPVGAISEIDFARCRYNDATNVVADVDVNAYCRANNATNGALYLDTTGFPVIDPTYRIAGSPQARWQGAVRNSVTLFKKLQLSALVDIKKGSEAWNGTRGALLVFGVHKETEIRGQQRVFGPAAGNVQGFYEDNVTGPGKGKAVVIGESWWRGDGGAFGDNGTQFIEDAGFVKLREISVGYTLDEPWVKSSGWSTIDLRLSGRNLRTWTRYRGIDPESNLAGAAGFIQGFDWFNNPQTRSFVISVGLNR